jgi:hypothetical protein
MLQTQVVGSWFMRDSWYYAVPEGQIGPITLQELKETLPNLPNAKDVYIWHDSLPDWIRAGDLAEIVANARMGAPQGGRSFDPAGVRAFLSRYHRHGGMGGEQIWIFKRVGQRIARCGAVRRWTRRRGEQPP